MEKRGDYSISDIYQGGYSSLKPNYGELQPEVNFRIASSELGATTNPTTANQIDAVSKILNQGIVPIEIGSIHPDQFDQIPKQHFKEINRLAKLTGAKISVHAPIQTMEPSGITEQGWSEENRQLIERRLNNVVDRAVEVSDDGGVPITIHASNIPGTEYKMTPDGKKVSQLMIINRESGRMGPLQEEIRHYPELQNVEKAKKVDPEEELKLVNRQVWEKEVSNNVFSKDYADRMLSESYPLGKELYKKLASGEISQENLQPQQVSVINRIHNADEYLKNTEMSLRSLFDRAYKFGTEEDRRKLKEISDKYRQALGIKGNEKPDRFDLMKKSQALQILINGLSEVTPEMYIPVEKFAIDKSAQTFANVAFNAFERYKDTGKVPTLSIENLYPGMAFSTGKEMKELIEKSREKFVEQAVKKGVSESVARKEAEKIIGMTLDVGHLNITKKHGFKDEDIAREAAEMAKYVKHVHLTDNFGYSDSHLPPGMGNVPIKKILEKIEKAGTLEGARKIVEAGGWIQHFQTSPLSYTLEAFGSPIYSMKMGPYWNQAMGYHQDYSGGYGMMLPQVNYETFGAGFSQLPMELGGQRMGAQGGRMSGRPME